MASYRPEDLDFAETAPIQIEAVEAVDGSRQEVWDVLLDYPGWTTWFSSLKECRATSDPATGIGSTRMVKLAGGATFDERFIAWDEPSVWAFTGTAGPPLFESLVERVTLRELSPTRTQVTYRMAIRPRRGLSPLVKAARGGVQKNLTAALRSLNTVVVGARES
jgi:uncharacterized protein YndB with AHSA1/START domain